MRPDVLVFDVNETLSSMTPLGATFRHIGLGEPAAATWFAGVLRDGFAVTAAGGTVTFRECAVDVLHRLLNEAGLPPAALDDAVAHVLTALGDLDAHPDVGPGLRALDDAGVRLLTLTNGSVTLSEPMLERAGVIDVLAHRLSVDAVGRWKPAPEPYRYACEVAAVDTARAALVAVHPWDVHGAQRAGLRGIWVNRDDIDYPAYLPAPDLSVRTLADLPAAVESL